MDQKDFKRYVQSYLIDNKNFIYKNGLLYKEFEDFFFIINIFHSDFGAHYKISYNYSIKELHKEKTLIDFDVQIARDLQSPENIFTEKFLSEANPEELNLELENTFKIIELLEKSGLQYIYKNEQQILFKESFEFLISKFKQKLKKEKIKNKFYNNVVYLVLMMVMSLIPYGMIILLFFTPNGDTSQSGKISWILLYIISFLCGTFFLIMGTILFGARIKFDEKGIHKAVLGKFFKKTISWEELNMIRLEYPFWCVFAKEDISNMNWQDKSKVRRKTIYLMFNEKVFQIIRNYTDKEIIGYNENKK